ncbi:MAG: hypothetical protein MUF01_12035 [Bryobacterales bacterium]|jgi:hypothetical protein|nr:hypothetical protein [Bryobacterales bacterium]
MSLPAGSWRVVARQPLLALMNLAALPVAALAAWGWLYLPDTNVPLVLASLLLAVVLCLGLLLLAQYTFLSYYRQHHPMSVAGSLRFQPRQRSLWRPAWGGLPPLLLWLLVFGGICWAISSLQQRTLDWAKPVASWVTMFTQRPVSFYSVNAIFTGALDFLQWVALPLLFLALFAGLGGAAVWGGGRRRWLRHSLGLLRLPQYWIAWLIFLAVSYWAPIQITTWTPMLEGIPIATASLLLRLGLALALLFLGWLLFLSVLARLLKFPKQGMIVLRRSTTDPA